MKFWQFTGEKAAELSDGSEMIESATAAKVKLTRCLLNRNDVSAFLGDASAYPVVPGSFGVGLVVETGDNCFGLEKNMRVYLNPFETCNNCHNCKNGNPSCCLNLKTAGQNTEGFLRDFAVCPSQQLYSLPDSVSEDDAVFIEYISLALKVIDTLDIQKGDHVAVLGFNTLGNILCQLIMYYQGVPILVDSDPENVETAKKAGVYYITEATAAAIKNVSSLTSGRMADKVVHTCDPAIDTKLAFQLAAYGCKLAFAGFDYGPIRMNLSHAMKKQLVIYSLKNGIGNTSSAINLLANKALSASLILKHKATFSSPLEALNEEAAHMEEEKKVYPIVVDMMN